MLNVKRLEVLVAVVERGSLSAAADALSYTQSAVSQSIARLEAETGVPLLHRGRRGVTPTDAGTLLVAHAGRILAEIAAAEAGLSQLVGAHRLRLRVGSFPSGGAALMPLAVARLRRVHPDVALTLVEGEPAQIAPRLRAGELDMALLYEFPTRAARRGGRAGLRTTVLLEDPLDLILPVEHRLAARRSLTLGDLRAEPWVQTSAASPCARHVGHCCEAAGFTPTVAFESDDYTTVLGLVAAGVGVALVPRLALGSGHTGVVVRRLTPASPVRLVTVATPAGLTPAPAARAMIAELTEVAQRYAEPTDPQPSPAQPRRATSRASSAGRPPTTTGRSAFSIGRASRPTLPGSTASV
jgi:DNA-binding transcriptional LysR family regulator